MNSWSGSARRKSPLFSALLVFLLTALMSGCASQKGKVEIGKPGKVKIVKSPEAYEHFVNGDLYLHAGDFRHAAEEFEKALLYDPDSYEIRLALAQTHYYLGDYHAARQEAEKLTIKTLDRELLLADCARSVNDLTEAKKRYLSALGFDSTNHSAWWYVARISERTGDSATAVLAQRQLAQLSGGYSNYFQLIQMLWAQKRNIEAAAAASRYIEIDSTDVKGYFLLGESLERDRQYGLATEVYRRVYAKDPSDRQVALHLGALYIELKEYPPAESILVPLLSDSSDFLPVFYLAEAAYAQRNYPRAETLYARAIKTADTIPDGFSGLAFTYLAQEKPERAVETAREGLMEFPGNLILRYWLGQGFSALKEYDSARTVFGQLASEQPQNVNYLFSYAAALERAGDFDSSVLVFKKVLSLAPEHAQALNYLGYSWADRNENLSEAKKMIEKALEREPENGAFLDSYGWVLFRLGKFRDAELQIRKALEKNSRDAIIVEHLGDIYRAMGRVEEARAQYQKALEMDPNNTALKEKLSR